MSIREKLDLLRRRLLSSGEPGHNSCVDGLRTGAEEIKRLEDDSEALQTRLGTAETRLESVRGYLERELATLREPLYQRALSNPVAEALIERLGEIEQLAADPTAPSVLASSFKRRRDALVELGLLTVTDAEQLFAGLKDLTRMDDGRPEELEGRLKGLRNTITSLGRDLEEACSLLEQPRPRFDYRTNVDGAVFYYGTDSVLYIIDPAKPLPGDYEPPPEALSYAFEEAEEVRDVVGERIGAPGASKPKRGYSGASFDVSPEAFAAAQEPPATNAPPRRFEFGKVSPLPLTFEGDSIDLRNLRNLAEETVARAFELSPAELRGKGLHADEERPEADILRGNLTALASRLSEIVSEDSGLEAIQGVTTPAEAPDATNEARADKLRLGALELYGYLATVVSGSPVAHIPGSILDELEEELREVAEYVRAEDFNLEDNLERVNVLRGVFDVYARKSSPVVAEAVKGAQTVANEHLNAVAFLLNAIDGGTIASQRVEAVRAGLIWLRAYFNAPEGAALPEPEEHTHTVMCIPFREALRGVRRAVDRFRLDTLEAARDFGDEVVSPATVTALNTLTARVFKIVDEAVGTPVTETTERLATEDIGYPKRRPLPGGAHNALVAARIALLYVRNAERGEGNSVFKIPLPHYRYVQESIAAVERELKLEAVGDMRLPFDISGVSFVNGYKEITRLLDELERSSKGELIGLGTAQDIAERFFNLRGYVQDLAETCGFLDMQRAEADDRAESILAELRAHKRKAATPNREVRGEPTGEGTDLGTILDTIERLQKLVEGEEMPGGYGLHGARTDFAALRNFARFVAPSMRAEGNDPGTGTPLKIVDRLYGAIWTGEACKTVYASLADLRAIREYVRKRVEAEEQFAPQYGSRKVDTRVDGGAFPRSGYPEEQGEVARMREEVATLSREISRVKDEEAATLTRVRELQGRMVVLTGAHARKVRELETEASLKDAGLLMALAIGKRLYACVDAHTQMFSAFRRAIGQLEDGSMLQARPEFEGLTPEQAAGKLLGEIKALAESSRVAGRDEMRLADENTPRYALEILRGGSTVQEATGE